jgi:tetratricopeptide (TPR) repeat protein
VANDFINFDDNVYITENNHIKAGLNSETIKWAFSAVVSSNWHPLTLLSHALDWSLFGANASGHHLVSLLLHIGSAILLFLFLSKTTGSLWPSAFVAALFSLHPLRVESVAWAAERKDVLSMFLGLAVLYTYSLYVEKPKLYKYCVCLILFALSRWQKALKPEFLPVRNDGGLVKKKGKQRKADSIKEKKISVPLMNRAKIIRSLLWEKIPFIFLALVSCIVTIWVQSKGGSVASLEKLPFLDRILNAIVSYVAYLIKIFWPVNLVVFYPYEQSFPSWQIFGATSILLGISIAAIYAIKKAPFLFVGWFWYLGTLVPVIGLIQVGKQAMADRYTYLPSIGIAIILTWGVVYLLSKVKLSKIIILPAAIILAALTFLTWQQCGYWKNSIELFNHTLHATKDNYLAHYNLGVALAAEGKNEEAIVHYLEVIKIKPDDANAHCNLGVALDADGKKEQALAHYLYALKINPHFDKAHYNLAMAFKEQGNIEESLKHFQKTLLINPNYPYAHNNIGIILEKYFKKYDEAIYHYEQELKIIPDNPGTHFNLGIALAIKGKLKEAAEHFRTAIYLKPDYEEASRALKLAIDMEKKQRVD